MGTMSAVKPVLSPLTRSALETEAYVATEGWGQAPRLFSLARNGDLLRREPALRAVLGDIDENEYSAVEQDDALATGELDEALGHLTWPADVDGVALAIERVIMAPDPDAARVGQLQQDNREDVRLLVAALRNGEIITLVRRKKEDDNDKVAIGTNIAPGLVDALKATLA